MATKREELLGVPMAQLQEIIQEKMLHQEDRCETPRGCLGKAAMDEPIFVSRAQDVTAPDLVRRWVREAISRGLESNSPKAKEAFNLADAMEKWQMITGFCKVPD